MLVSLAIACVLFSCVVSEGLCRSPSQTTRMKTVSSPWQRVRSGCPSTRVCWSSLNWCAVWGESRYHYRHLWGELTCTHFSMQKMKWHCQSILGFTKFLFFNCIFIHVFIYLFVCLYMKLIFNWMNLSIGKIRFHCILFFFSFFLL